LFIQSLKRLFFPDSTISRFQDNLTEFTEQLVQNKLLKGNYFEDITIGTSATLVEHKLGVKPMGYLIAKQNASATIFNIESQTDDKFLALQASTSVKISIWVF
jgi:hypothetical protein